MRIKTGSAGRWAVGIIELFLALSAHAQNLSPTVNVREIDVRGNSLLSSSQVSQALGAGSASLDLAGLQALAQRLQQAYRSAGYGAVVVVLPEQRLQDGVLRLEVIEGRLRQVQVTGHQGFSRGNILASLPALQLGQTPRLLDLDRELIIANENPAKSVRVVFQPGEARGDVEALVVVDEQDTGRVLWVLDNSGTRDSGRYRLAAHYQHANVADRDIVFGLRAATSPSDPSHVAILGSSLRLPWYRQRLAVEASLLASNTRSASNATPAGELRFSGRGLAAGARLIWTLASPSEAKTQLSLGLDARRYRNDCSLGSFGAAGCGSAGASVDVLPLTAGIHWHRPGSLSASAQWVSNLPFGSAGRDADFEASRPGASSRYGLLRWGLQGQQRVSADWALAWRGDGQWTARPLVFAEQYGAGGAHSVRGYDERVLRGDLGATASLELQRGLGAAALPTWMGELMLSGFVDAAALGQRGDATCANGRARCGIWSAGLGLSGKLSPQTQWRADLAWAAQAAPASARGDGRLHFNIQHRL